MQTRLIEHRDRFVKTQTQCKHAVWSTKRKFEQKIVTNGNKHPFNSYIKSVTKSRVNVGPLKVGSVTISDNTGIASKLMIFFCTVFSQENVNNIPICNPVPNISDISDVYISPDLVKHKLDKLKLSSYKGPDGITSRFLKDFSNVLADPLSIIYKKSVSTGEVPVDWKLANVTPIFKKGSKSRPDN